MLAAAPSLLGRADAQGQRRVSDLVTAMQQLGIDSRGALAAAWSRDGEVLLPELGQWLSKGQRSLLMQLWPQLLRESRVAPDQRA